MIVADFALCLHFDTRLYSMDCQAIITMKIGSVEVLFAFCFFDPMRPKFQKPFFFFFCSSFWHGMTRSERNQNHYHFHFGRCVVPEYWFSNVFEGLWMSDHFNHFLCPLNWENLKEFANLLLSPSNVWSFQSLCLPLLNCPVASVARMRRQNAEMAVSVALLFY